MSATCASAANVDYSVEAGVGRSDNIRRTSSDEVGETIGTAGVQLGITQNSRRMVTNVSADLAYYNYFDNTYNGEVIGNFNGLVDLRIVPETFDWIFQDNFGQVRSDPFAPVTPDNRENVNYFTTGPDLTLHFGSQTGLHLSGQYSNVNYEKSPLDSNRYMGAVALFRDLSAASVLSANMSNTKTSYDSAVAGADYTKQEAFGRYELKGNRTRIGFDAGYSRLRQSTGNDNGWLARLDVDRRVSASSVVSLKLGHEFSDAGSTFVQQQRIGATDLDAQTGVQTANPFISEYANVSWNFDRQRTAFGVGLSYYDQAYVVQKLLDDTRTLIDAHVSRQLGPAFDVQLTASYSRNDFKNTVGDFDEIGASAILTWRLGRKLRLLFQYEHFDRNSDLPASGFTENRAWIRLRYGDAVTPVRPGFSQQPQA